MNGGCINEEDYLLGRNPFSISFKADGRLIEFDGTGIMSGLLPEYDVYVIALSGAGDLRGTEEKNIFFLSFLHDSPIPQEGFDYIFESKSYVRDEDFDPLGAGNITYFIDQDGIQYEAVPHLFDHNSFKNTSYRIRFTSISSELVEGTFSGVYFSSAANKFLNITEGKFSVMNLFGKT
jgi:hypothetical protein